MKSKILNTAFNPALISNKHAPPITILNILFRIGTSLLKLTFFSSNNDPNTKPINNP